jgi:hypothetical protein
VIDSIPPEKPQQSSVLMDMLPHVLRTLTREPALVITICYLLVALAGIFYNYSFYLKFGIPILSLSQIGDFLVAGIQRPMALLLVATTFPLCWILDLFNARSRRRHARTLERLQATPAHSWWGHTIRKLLVWRVEKRWYTQIAYVVIILAYSWSFVSIYANYRAKAVKRGEAAQVAVWLTGDAAGFLPAQAKSWTYLGAVANYVFVYDPSSRRAVILPVNGIARIEPVQSLQDAQSPIIVAPIP